MTLRRLVIAIGLAAGLWPSASWAQRTGSNLNVGVDISGVFDSDVADEIRQRSAQGGLESGGLSSALVGRAGYSRNLRRVRLNGSIQSSLRYYAESERVTPVGHTGGVTAGFTLGGRTTIDVTQNATYSPSYLYQLFPSAIPVDPSAPMALAQDYRIDQFTSFSRQTRVRFAMPSRLGAFSVLGERLATEFYGRADARPTVEVDVAQVGSSWRLGRRYTLSAEFNYRQGNFGNGVAIDQRFRIGAAYSRPLSATRRAALRFAVAPSTFRGPASGTTAVNTARRGLDVTTGASVDISRNWSLNGSIRRGIEYLATLGEPIVNTGGSVGVAGPLFGGVQLGVSGGYSEGRSALTARTQANNLRTYTGSLRLARGITRSISAYGEYLYYYYDLRGQAILAPDLPSVFERRSVRFGVSMSARPIGRR